MRFVTGAACGWLVLSAAAATAAACAANSREIPEERAPGGGWSAPAALTPQVVGSVRHADLFVGDSGPYVADFSFPLRAEAGGQAAVSRLRVRSPRGHWIDPPAGRFTFGFPRIAVDGGALHMVWAEPLPDDPDGPADAAGSPACGTPPG